jgi:hypothetical protein
MASYPPSVTQHQGGVSAANMALMLYSLCNVMPDGSHSSLLTPSLGMIFFAGAVPSPGDHA